MRQMIILIVVTLSLIVVFGAACTGTDSAAIPPAPPGAITARFLAEGFTLSITANCERSQPLCPFRAEVSAPSQLFGRIERVDYSSPDRGKSPTSVTAAANNFPFEGKQKMGNSVFAQVTLRAPAGSLTIEGTIPFSAEVKPALPAGLRFEDTYQPWYLEGDPHNPGAHIFKIRLRGEATALDQIRSVDYEIPAQYSNNWQSRVTARRDTEFFVEGHGSPGAQFEIVANINWKKGTRTRHTIPYRPG